MNPQAFDILEFGSLRALVRRHAQTEMGRTRVDALEPFADFAGLERALRETHEALELRPRGVRFSFEDIPNLAGALALLKIEGSALEALTILDLLRLCDTALDARAAILAERDNAPALFEIVKALSNDLRKVTAGIAKKILPNGELDDRASPELARIRREIARLRSSITRSLESIMRRSSEAVQEELVTLRNDRFVIPVRADHRGRINGVAHGSSSSGATIFIEPIQTIEANNELQTLRESEQREIAEILFQLSEALRKELPGIELAAAAIAELDFVNAKAAFAEKFNCAVPEIVTEPDVIPTRSKTQTERNGTATLEFIEARHPLLQENLRGSENEVVPVSFRLDGEQTTMVISGANAGGKTVVLKTAGLLSLMALSGLPVPARLARVPFYRSILADIGDHQSIAANLSTFTSHVANIGSMIERCEIPALVLLDEVGTGTDPEEGSALGVAVVDHFKKAGAHVLASTHYSGLKMYAANEAGVLNASVEFDEKTLRPTYRLLTGVAGSSSGLEIARRFGIPAEVIDSASGHVSESSRDAIEYLRKIKLESEEAEALRRALEEERAAVAEKFAKLEVAAAKREAQRQTEFERQLGKVTDDFAKRTRELVEKVQERADRVKVEREAQKRVAELKREAQRAAAELPRSKTAPQVESDQAGSPPQLRGIRVIRDGKLLSNPAESLEVSEPVESTSIKPDRELRVGDQVRLLSFGSIGSITQIKDDAAEVRVGSLHMREKLASLELITDATAAAGGRLHASQGGSSPTVREGSLEKLKRQAATTELHLHSKSSDSQFPNNELNLIGKTTDEAVEIVDKFLDAAFLDGLNEVRIIHGHGTGALRRAISDLLADHPHVARFSAAPQNKGGSGATVVELLQ